LALSAVAKHCSGLQQLNIVCGGSLDATKTLVAVSRQSPNLRALKIDSGWRRDAATWKVTNRLLRKILPFLAELRKFELVGDAHRVTKHGFQALAASCPNLHSLVVEGVDDDGLKAFGEQCKHISELSLCGDFPVVSSSVLRYVSVLWPSLTVLNLYDSHGAEISDDALQNIANNCPLLKELRILFQLQVTDIGVQAIAAKCSHLHTLDVDMCELLTDASLVAVGEHCPRLRVLHCGIGNGDAWIPQVTDKGVEAVARGCLALEELDVDGCEGITDAALRALARSSRNLRFLRICCPLVTTGDMANLGMRCKKLREVNSHTRIKLQSPRCC